MNILDQIIAHKEKEVALRKAQTTIKELESRPLFASDRISAKDWVSNPEKTGIIAEFKRKSPSKGLINGTAQPQEVAQGYEAAGASAMSVLTDINYFGGADEDLINARKAASFPLLRKDFIIDEYQLVEARSIGADLILLIAANLTPAQLKSLAEFAHSLQLQVLMEVHNLEELQGHLCEHVDLVGVNNRNLKTFEVSLDVSKSLAEHIPNEFLKISESGLHSVDDLLELQQFGFDGFLIGENFMKTENPGKAAMEFMSAFQELRSFPSIKKQ